MRIFLTLILLLLSSEIDGLTTNTVVEKTRGGMVPPIHNGLKRVAVDWLKCDSSSELSSCDNAFKGDNILNSEWSVKGAGQGEWIQANLATPSAIEEIVIVQGRKDKGVREVELLFDGNIKATAKLLTVRQDTHCNVIKLSKAVTTATVRITIKKVEGENSVGISKIAFYGNIPKTDPPLPENLCNIPTPTCNSSYSYSSFDGTCNNLDNPFWGSTYQPLKRLVPAQYGPNFTARGAPDSLQNPRLLSTMLHMNVNRPDERLTHLVAAFGQFVDHDITFTPTTEVECCHHKGHDLPDNCSPIKIPAKDPFFSKMKPPQTCMEFGRSFPYCSAPEREQFNALTAFIDGSSIYGSDEETANKLRSKVDGKLKTNRFDLLPEIGGSIAAGDRRAAVQPGLTSMHTLWMREHNRMANLVKSKHPGYNDEELYLKTRQLVVAELQNVIYNEWLPIILGNQLMTDFNLKSTKRSQYDKKVNPTISNSFATAAFRFGHTLIQGTGNMFSSLDGRSLGSYQLRYNYHNTSLYLQGNGETFENIVTGHTRQPCQKYDRYVTEDLTNFLFAEQHGLKFGTDLMARNIARGRDHGLPGYNKFRQICNMSLITSMKRTPPEFNPEKWARLTALYTRPDDIDLWTAALSENHLSDGVVGPTFGCIIAQQFNRLKFGDRFFFTTEGESGSLTSKEFRFVRSMRMRNLLCKNTSIRNLQANVFFNDKSFMSPC